MPGIGAEGPSPHLVGRDRARERCGAFIAAVPMAAASIVISGEAGIGKTALWRDCIDRCRRAGYSVLLARTSEEEMLGELVGLRDLFDLDLDASAFAPDLDSFERGRVVVRALRKMTSTRPVIVALDDLQWLDAASARVLRYALRRLDEEPIGVLATWRSDAAADDRLTIAHSFPASRRDAIDLGPLTQPELRRLLSEFVGAISPMTLRRVHDVSGGNPLYATELARELDGNDRAVRDPENLQLPDSLQGAIERRLATVPPSVLGLLRVVAATGPATLADLARYLPDQDVDTLVTEASGLGLLVVEEDLRVRFAHPLIGSAVYGRIDPLARRSLHRQLADRTSDPEVRIRHLALSTDEADAEVAALLEAAAERARHRGASDVAAAFARHARRLTPLDDQVGASRRALAEITNLAAAGEASRALALVDELVAALPPSPARARALVQRFYVENDEVEAGDATLLQALDDAAGDALLRGEVLDILGWHRGVFRGDLPRGIACARKAVEIADQFDAPAAWMQAAGHLAHMQALAGAPQEEVMERAVALVDEIGGPLLGGGPKAWLAKQRLWAGDLPGARALFLDVQETHDATGNELERSYRMYDMALLACASGDFASAWEHTVRGIEAALDSRNGDAEGWMHYPLALVEAWRGRNAEARAAADRLLGWPGRPGETIGAARARSVLGLLELSEGDAASAVVELREAMDLVEATGIAHPGALPVLPDLVVAYGEAGDVAAARRLLPALQHQATALGYARTRAMWRHAEGLVLLADGDAETALSALAEAREVFDRLGLRPDAGRVVLATGQALLRMGRRTEAAATLAAAHRRFAEIGARLWEARALVDLERASPGRASGELTPTEARVSALAAEGKKNREIAATLFMSVASVEAHLTRVYRKFDIRSRTQLARLVHDGTIVVEPDGD